MITTLILSRRITNLPCIPTSQHIKLHTLSIITTKNNIFFTINIKQTTSRIFIWIQNVLVWEVGAYLIINPIPFYVDKEKEKGSYVGRKNMGSYGTDIDYR